MEPSVARVLIVANRTAASPALLDAIRERAARGSCEFVLLVPDSPGGMLDRMTGADEADHGEAHQTLELALPLLEDAAGGEVEGRLGDAEPLAAVEDALNLEHFDEVIVSTLPTRASRWLRLDLPHKVAGLDLPVTTVTAKGRSARAPS